MTDKLTDVLRAAHQAADELDAWDGDASPVLEGMSPGGVVRQAVHDGLGVCMYECPVCGVESEHDRENCVFC